MRALLERLSRNVILKRRLPQRNGGRPLYVSPGASLRFWRPGLERSDPLLLEVARRHVPGGATVWDVGANVGLFTFAAAARARDVLAVEADPWLADLIRRSAALRENADLEVEVLHAAVSDRPGSVRFALARRGRAASHLSAVSGSSQTGGAAAELTVPGVTLDGLLEARRAPGFVKIDVEGAELLVLKGAARLLADVRPVLYCEVSAACAAEVTAILRGHAYRLYDPERDPALAGPLQRAVWNTLALP